MTPVFSEAEPVAPWAPVLTRPGQPVVLGIIYVWAEDRSLYANAGHSLLRLGNTRLPLMGGSLLNPFQMMTLYPVLKEAYPVLQDAHIALMAASCPEEFHLEKAFTENIEMLLSLGGLTWNALRCEACEKKQSGRDQTKRSVNPCSGMRLATALYQKALTLNGEKFPESERSGAIEPFEQLKALLGYLLNQDSFEEDFNGCGLPTLALNAVEWAQLYHALIMPVSSDYLKQCPDELTESLRCWNIISDAIRRYENRPETGLGSWLMNGKIMNGNGLSAGETQIPILAQVDCDSCLLCLGIGKNTRFADGLGILIALKTNPDSLPSSQSIADDLGVVTQTLLHQLGLLEPVCANPADIQFHFSLSQTSVSNSTALDPP